MKALRGVNLENCPDCLPGTVGRHMPGCPGIIKLRKAQMSQVDAKGFRLSKEEIKALCDAAEIAWSLMPRGRRAAKFTWRACEYVVSHSSFRMLVHTMSGKPVACRYD